MAHSYKSQYPRDVAVEPSIVQFFENFYAVSDTPDAHDVYVDQFTDDATFILASKVSRGRDGRSLSVFFCPNILKVITSVSTDSLAEIRSTRCGMWSAVSSRQHTVFKVFPFGSSAREFMLYGTVEFGFRNGQQGAVDWAARAEMSQEGGRWRMSFYQVYLVSSVVYLARSLNWICTNLTQDTGSQVYKKE
ncbi:hypothetical protein VTK73DRAFT_4124 [Phialemonium thermophilum]|uniref:SnoaL-like domain-containing protein n=1 Tax=Phialemonium thermophilum TaxID=223376 RepID=A0ABR3VBA9_9PEZI